MSVGWSGADPVDFSDGGSATYELGTEFTAAADVTINNVRVWGHAASASRANRAGKIWSNGGSLLATATFPNVLLAGWHTYALDAPVAVPSGTTIIVSYDVTDTYGANTSPGYPRASSDTLVTAVRGRRDLTTPDVFPTGTTTGAFYGIDIDYTAGIGGNQRPVVGISVAKTNLAVAATLTITDESPSTVTYVIEWGDGQSSLGLTGLGPHTHTYAAAGTYAVMVTATDNGGLTDSAAVAVSVAPAFVNLDMEALQQAMATAAATISGLRCYPSLPGAIAPPTFAPVEFEMGYKKTFGRGASIGMTEVTVTCGVYVPDTPEGRKLLMPYLAPGGSKSVLAALEADRTLAGTCRTLSADRVRGAYRLYTVGDTDYLGAMIDVRVWA